MEASDGARGGRCWIRRGRYFRGARAGGERRSATHRRGGPTRACRPASFARGMRCSASAPPRESPRKRRRPCAPRCDAPTANGLVETPRARRAARRGSSGRTLRSSALRFHHRACCSSGLRSRPFARGSSSRPPAPSRSLASFPRARSSPSVVARASRSLVLGVFSRWASSRRRSWRTRTSGRGSR